MPDSGDNINRVKVSISGQTYTIQGDADPEYIYRLADYVDGKMGEISRGMSGSNPTQVAILTALNIADEYFQLKDIEKGIDGAISQKAQALISMLEEGIIGDIFTKTTENHQLKIHSEG